jgi:hypothetical protein
MGEGKINLPVSIVDRQVGIYLPIFSNFPTQDTFLVYLSYLFDINTHTQKRQDRALLIISISLLVGGINYLDQTYTTYWKNIMSLPFFCFLLTSAISFFTSKNLNSDLSTYFSQYFLHTTKLHIVP